jgi:hypothetical protein
MVFLHWLRSDYFSRCWYNKLIFFILNKPASYWITTYHMTIFNFQVLLRTSMPVLIRNTPCILLSCYTFYKYCFQDNADLMIWIICDVFLFPLLVINIFSLCFLVSLSSLKIFFGLSHKTRFGGYWLYYFPVVVFIVFFLLLWFALLFLASLVENFVLF